MSDILLDATIAAGTATNSTQVKKAWAADELLARTEDALDSKRRSVFADATLAGLDRKLSDFEDALDAFRMPAANSPWFQARLVTGAPQANGYVAADLRQGDAATPSIKAFSSGFEGWRPTSLDAGAYGFNLSLGGKTEPLTVTVAQGDTWDDVLQATANAVNAAGLPVRADVTRQNGAFELGPDIAGTGSLLTFSINPARKDQSPSLTDTSGHLLSALGVRASQSAVGPASEGNYNVQVMQLAQPTFYSSTPVDPGAATTLAVGRHDMAFSVGTGDQPTSYISKAYDPAAASGVAAGTYGFSVTADGETRTHSVTIGSGWTWNDVLQAVRAEISGNPATVDSATHTLAGGGAGFSQPGVSASVAPWSIPSSTSSTLATDGASLTVTGEAGKNFSMADGSGGLLTTLGLTTRLTGTPVSFNVYKGDTWKDAYQRMAVALNGSQDSFTASVADVQMPATNLPGKTAFMRGVTLQLLQHDQRIGERVGLSDGRTGALSATGIASRQSPGTDGVAVVNGQTQVSENNLYSEDQGRVIFAAKRENAEVMPLAVRSAVDAVEKGWGAVTDAWNSLARYLRNNGDLLNASLGAHLEAPLGAQAANLRWMGVTNAGRNGQLWTNTDAFWSALSADHARATGALTAPQSGLVPGWKRAVADVRAGVAGGGLETWLKPASAFESQRPSLTSEFQLEQKHRLVKLLG